MATEAKAPRSYLYSISTLRGVFVLLVCLLHFADGSGLTHNCYDCVEAVGAVAYPGMLGFFIISGFGITWSMYQGGYSLRFVPRFYLKRITRAEPPYLIGLVLIVATYYLVSLRPGHVGPPMIIDWIQVALHVGYLVPFFGYQWLNPVFWTLSVEFQFYLAVGLLYPLFTSRDWRVRTLTMLALLAVYWVAPRVQYVVNAYIPLFLIGIVMFQQRVGIISRREQWFWLIPLVLLTLQYPVGVVVEYPVGVIAALMCVICIGMLLKNDHYSPLGNWIGEVSYSLYLVHPPVSLLVLGTLLHFSTSIPVKLFGVALSLVLSVLAAKVYYRWVEKPWFQRSHRIRYPKIMATTTTLSEQAE